MKFWERNFDQDYQKCKRVLSKALRNIRIDFVDPKYEFKKTVSFNKNEINVYDQTLY